MRELRLKMKPKGEVVLSMVIGAWSFGFTGAARLWGTDEETGQQWPAHVELLQETFQVPHNYCRLPHLELWSKRFDDWTDADWNDPENLSALWDLSGHLTGKAGQVLWARGTHHINEMPRIGLPAPEFLKAAGSR